MNMIKQAYWNAEEDRPRAAMRIIGTIAVTAGLIMGVQMLINFTIGGLPDDPAFKLLLRTFMVALAGTGGFYIGRMVVDKKSFLSLGLTCNQAAFKDLGFGLLLSFIMVTLFFALQLSLGLIEFNRITLGAEDGISLFELMLKFLSIGLFVSWFDELFYRGIIYQNMEEGLGLQTSVILSCLLYGLIYMFNGVDATWHGGLVIVLLGGIRLLGYLRTRQLWLSMGMHAGWNFCMSAFGYKISAAPPSGAIAHIVVESDWLSGGAFGPEASILALPIVMLAMSAILWWTEGRQEPAKDAEAAPTSSP